MAITVGPYDLHSEKEISSISDRPGAYVLYEIPHIHGRRVARYVGRSDTSLRDRLMDHRGQYSVFFVRYADTPDKAFRFECEFYHRHIDTIKNKIHPDRPDGSDAVCPICGHPDSRAMVDSRLFGRR